MRNIEYILLPPVGSGEVPVYRSIADLLRDVPYLLVSGIIPPLPVVNQILRSGLEDAGMSGGCRWKPFELSKDEFAEVLDDLQATGGRDGDPLRFEEPPTWVETPRDWHIWVAERVYAIPAEENRRLSRAMEQVEAAMKAAEAAGNDELRIEHLCRSPLSGQTSYGFIASHPGEACDA